MSSDPRAVLTRPAPPPDRVVRYGDHPDQVADVRLPPADRPWRAPVLLIHGGFWRAKYDRAHTGPLAAALAAAGHPVAQLEYRRTGQPGGGWPATLTDVAVAVRRVPRSAFAGTTAADAPPVLVGHSAGGQLAMWVADPPPAAGAELALPVPAEPVVRAVVALAPVADLTAAYDHGLDSGAVAALLGGGPADVPRRYAAAQPRQCPRVPVTLVHGVRDGQVPVAMSRRWVAAARAAGCQPDYRELEGIEHFGLIDPLSVAWREVCGAITDRG